MERGEAWGVACKAETRLPLDFTFGILLRDDRHDARIRSTAFVTHA